MVRLQAVGWDHDRCMRPMRAAAREWQRLTGTVVDWTVRSGESFAAQPIDQAAQGVDLISFDHPFVGQAADRGALLPLDDLLPSPVLQDLAEDAVGRSHECYRWAGRQWGLAADAACQVSVVRPDLLGDTPSPVTWDDAMHLARRASGHVTTALSSHDAMCTLLTLCASAGAPLQPNGERFADPQAALPALEWLSEYSQHCHDSAWAGYVVGPMSTSDDICYALLQWGYTDYARRSFTGPRLRYVDIPSAGSGPTGSTLGGAGLGVSATSAHPREAAEFAAWVCLARTQRDVVYPAGGQPASTSAWRDGRLDDDAGGFFSGTYATITQAVLRPRDPWWPRFQDLGGQELVNGLRERTHPRTILDRLERQYRAAANKGAR